MARKYAGCSNLLLLAIYISPIIKPEENHFRSQKLKLEEIHQSPQRRAHFEWTIKKCSVDQDWWEVFGQGTNYTTTIKVLTSQINYSLLRKIANNNINQSLSLI